MIIIIDYHVFLLLLNVNPLVPNTLVVSREIKVFVTLDFHILDRKHLDVQLMNAAKDKAGQPGQGGDLLKNIFRLLLVFKLWRKKQSLPQGERHRRVLE